MEYNDKPWNVVKIYLRKKLRFIFWSQEKRKPEKSLSFVRRDHWWILGIQKSEKIIQLLEFLVVAKIQSYYYETAKLEEFLVVAEIQSYYYENKSISSTLEIIEDKKWTKKTKQIQAVLTRALRLKSMQSTLESSVIPTPTEVTMIPAGSSPSLPC